MSLTSSVLVICAHPAMHRSEINRPMFDIASTINGVTAIDLYALYPNFHIDIVTEQRRLLDHQVIIFQFPLFWYSMPALLKEWQDLILQYGFAYGKGGNSLVGKQIICAISAGAQASAYSVTGDNHYPIANYLLPIEQTARLTQMQYHQPLVLYGAGLAKEDQRLASHLHHWQEFLIACVNHAGQASNLSEVLAGLKDKSQ